MPSRLSPKSVHKLRLSQSEIEQRTNSGIPYISSHILISCDDFHLGFLSSSSSSITHHHSIPSDLNKEHTMDSIEFSQIEIPNALASDQHIFPLHAADEAPNSSSWLSLWNAQIISRYRNRSLRPVFRGIAPEDWGLVGVEARRLTM